MLNSEEQNIIKKDFSISLAAANLYSIPLMIIPFILFGVPYYAFWGKDIVGTGRINLNAVIIITAVFICGAAIHEFIHALYWVKLGRKKWSRIKFGFSIKTLTPYVHCREPISAHAYKVGTSAPGLILGIIPSLISIISGNVWLFWFGILFTVSAAGDFIILWLIRKVDPASLVEDHPSRAGCYVYQ